MASSRGALDVEITIRARITSPPATTPRTRPRAASTRVTGAPVRVSPPSACRWPTSAAARRPAPPRGDGQPTAWPHDVEVDGGDGAAGPVGGVSPCRAALCSQAADPGDRKSSDASAVEGCRSSRAKSSTPSSPSPSASRAGPVTGGKPASIVARMASQCSSHGATKPAQRSPSPGASALSDVRVTSTSRASDAARPSSRTWTICSSGSTHSSPWTSRGQRAKTGEAADAG
jgi:hypothetical protein